MEPARLVVDASDPRSMLVIEGEAGIGKSRLAGRRVLTGCRAADS
ncbi:hypothetical protein [Streptomyces coryli]|nr:hypothetical protein [Streptomyces coryli]